MTGTDVLGNTWITSNGPAVINSSFTMANSVEASQPFNRSNYKNGLGNFANSFQLTVNKSQLDAGFRGLLQTPAASGFGNEFLVKTSADPASWTPWIMSYNLKDAASGLFQQVLFTAPTGTQLSQDQDFAVNINFAGVLTTDSGWAASWNDRVVNDVPEPDTLALMGLGVVGLLAAARRKKA